MQIRKKKRLRKLREFRGLRYLKAPEGVTMILIYTAFLKYYSSLFIALSS
jgi:hypothetical protein